MSRQRKQLTRFLLPIILSLVTLLTGCVRYDVGIDFDNPQHGKIVQQIKIGEQLTSLSQAEAKKWLNSIEARSRALQGKVKRLSAQEILVTIPFGNGKELTEKFNQFFHSDTVATATPQAKNMNLLKLDSQIALQQNNLLFLERNLLDLTIDLRALGVLSEQGKIVVSPGSLINLEFQLNTPLRAYSVAGENNLEPIATVPGEPLVWQLQPGQINHIEAVFWLPSPIGIAIAVIILLAILGYVLKYRRLPGVA
ncbi:DUF3153 domain-containing protein [Myxosarcina sp. GI1(2024)]